MLLDDGLFVNFFMQDMEQINIRDWNRILFFHIISNTASHFWFGGKKILVRILGKINYLLHYGI